MSQPNLVEFDLDPENDLGLGDAHEELFELDGRSGSGQLTKIYLEHPEKIPEMLEGHAELIVGYLSARSKLGENVDIKLTAEELALLEKAREKLESRPGKIRGALIRLFAGRKN